MNWSQVFLYFIYDIIRLVIPSFLAIIISFKISKKFSYSFKIDYLIWPIIFIIILFAGKIIIYSSLIGIEITNFLFVFLLSLLCLTMFISKNEIFHGINVCVWLDLLLIIKSAYLNFGISVISLPSLGSMFYNSLEVINDMTGIVISLLLLIVIGTGWNWLLQHLSRTYFSSQKSSP